MGFPTHDNKGKLSILLIPTPPPHSQNSRALGPTIRRLGPDLGSRRLRGSGHEKGSVESKEVQTSDTLSPVGGKGEVGSPKVSGLLLLFGLERGTPHPLCQ